MAPFNYEECQGWCCYHAYQLLLEGTLTFLNINIQIIILKMKTSSSQHFEQNGETFYTLYPPEDT